MQVRVGMTPIDVSFAVYPRVELAALDGGSLEIERQLERELFIPGIDLRHRHWLRQITFGQVGVVNRRGFMRENTDCLRAEVEDVVMVALHLRQAVGGQKGDYQRSCNTRPDDSAKPRGAISLGAKESCQLI